MLKRKRKEGEGYCVGGAAKLEGELAVAVNEVVEQRLVRVGEALEADEGDKNRIESWAEFDVSERDAFLPQLVRIFLQVDDSTRSRL